MNTILFGYCLDTVDVDVWIFKVLQVLHMFFVFWKHCMSKHSDHSVFQNMLEVHGSCHLGLFSLFPGLLLLRFDW